MTLKTRDEYSWEALTHDLALYTSLTLPQASDIAWELRNTSIHPYDALPHLTRLFDQDIPQRAEALAALLDLNQQTRTTLETNQSEQT